MAPNAITLLVNSPFSHPASFSIRICYTLLSDGYVQSAARQPISIADAFLLFIGTLDDLYQFPHSPLLQSHPLLRHETPSHLSRWNLGSPLPSSHDNPFETHKRFRLVEGESRSGFAK